MVLTDIRTLTTLAIAFGAMAAVGVVAFIAEKIKKGAGASLAVIVVLTFVLYS